MSVNGDLETMYGSSGETSLLNSSGHTVDIQVLPRRVPQGTSWFLSSFIVINAALGGGLLAFPEAYHRSGGVIVALSVQAVMLVFAFLSLLILAYCSDKCSADTFQDVVQGMCGAWSQRLSSLCIAIYCFGTSITFLIIIGDQWDRFFYFVTKNPNFCKEWFMNRNFVLSVTSILFILPLCFPKRIDFLRHASMVGVLSIIYVSVLVVVKYFTQGPVNPGPIRTKPAHWTDVFIVIPTICFGYQCHISVIPVYACLKKRNLANFVKCVTVAMLACMACYSSVAVCGYLTFGSHVPSDILQSYDTTVDVVIGIILLAVKIYTTYPILHFCGRSALLTVITDVFKLHSNVLVERELLLRSVVTIVWFGLSLLLAITIPNIADVIEILGGLAVVFIFVLPGLCLMKFTLQNEAIWVRPRFLTYLLTACSFIVIGAFIFGVCTTNAIQDDISGANDVSQGNGTCIG